MVEWIGGFFVFLFNLGVVFWVRCLYCESFVGC